MNKILGIAFVVLLLSSNVFAYDNVIVHQNINENAALNASNFISSMRALGFKGNTPKEIVEINVVDKKKIKDWIREGGKQEDVPVERTLRHFHDPLKAWNSAGFKGEGLSSLLWAQDQSNFRGSYGGDWSWKKAREFYYSALISTSGQQREQGFANAFRALGQVMHLMSDASVPAHVRNDAHVFPNEFAGLEVGSQWQTYESWAKRQMTANATGKLNFTGVSPAAGIFAFAKNTIAAPVPISALWDTDAYTGADIRTATGFDIGLAEYTNANFFSEDTIFRDYPHPTYADTNYLDAINHPERVDAEDGKFDNRVYIRKTVGDADTRLVSFGYISYDCIKKGKYDFSPFVLDDNVYNDYAALLIPRAVGYSAALLNYFFRGDMKLDYNAASGFVIRNNSDERMEGDFGIYYDTADGSRWPVWAGRGWVGPKGDWAGGIDFIPPSDAKVQGKYTLVFKGKMGNEDGAVAGYVFQRILELTPPEQLVYSMADPSQPVLGFTSVKVKVKNASPSEAMQNGTLQAVAKYKTDIEDTEFIYSVSASKSISSLSASEATEFDFNFENDPIPLDVTDLSLQVIFKGKIGDENEAVALGIKDISEPTPIDIFNNMDRICINGSWYVTGSAEAYNALPEPAKWWDYWTHDFKDVYIKVSPSDNPSDASPTNYTFFVPLIESGDLYRMYILSDYDFVYSDYGFMVEKDTGDNYVHDNVIKKTRAQGMGVRNQTEFSYDLAFCSTYGYGSTPCTAVRTSSFYPFRGVEMWGPGGFVVDGVTYPNYTDPDYVPCSWDALK
jgi:hypothetical protein